MRAGMLCLVLWALAWSGAWAQEKQQQNQEDQQQDRPAAAGEKRPTLGPPPAPSLYGPRTSTTTDARKLMRIRTVYVDRIDNLLSEKLAEGISKAGIFRVVANRSEADAVVRGTCSDMRRLKTVHSEIYITERGSGTSIWQDSIRRPYNPPPLGKVVDETAALVLAHLQDSLKQSDRK